ncbi:MAG TPA: class I SAM-dependent methyltransferase [Gemmatimonadaceae bacterium]|nr:class I SAM-dependent methyltransferase [Gemmatimonadaceae bacterium]
MPGATTGRGAPVTMHGADDEAALAAVRTTRLALFRASVLKQAKWRALSAAIGPTEGLDALDLGADTGAISWMFRQQGGRWWSADLTEETVAAITVMVGERVERLTGASLPFPDAAFDRIVVVDLLEHVDDDRHLLAEIARCLRPGGFAVLNIPHQKRWAVLPPIRHAIGLTDAWHGHVRPGYDVAVLERLLPASLRLVRTSTYSRFCSHLLDTALNWAYLRRCRARPTRTTAKGTIITGTAEEAGSARTLQRLAPLLRAFTSLDALLPWTRGYMLLATVRKRSPSSIA